jgi:hypothetical protein
MGVINGVTPGTFNYWVKVTAAAGSNTFVTNQSITTGNFNTLFELDTKSAVYDSSCRTVRGATFTQSSTTGTTSTVKVRFNAATAGTYYIQVKFDTANIDGHAAPSPSTVGYSFDTAGVPGSTAGLNLVLKH